MFPNKYSMMLTLRFLDSSNLMNKPYILIVISKHLKCYLKAKPRATAYSLELRRIRGIVQEVHGKIRSDFQSGQIDRLAAKKGVVLGERGSMEDRMTRGMSS